MTRLVILALATLLSGCVPTVFLIGSSITWGTPTTGGNLNVKEPGGGYPDKLVGVLNAHVGNRGIPGWSTALFNGRPCTHPNCLDDIYWPPYASTPAYPYWTDLPTPAPEPHRSTYLNAIVYRGVLPASSVPRICVVMVGVNDLFFHGGEAPSDTPAQYAANYAFPRYQALISDLASVCSTTVLVNTELCGEQPGDLCLYNDRCRADDGRCDAPYLHEYNDLIRTTYGTNVIDMDVEFQARGGTAGMFADGIHPNCAGYKIMAEVVRDGLVSRGLVTLTGTPIAACPS